MRPMMLNPSGAGKPPTVTNPENTTGPGGGEPWACTVDLPLNASTITRATKIPTERKILGRWFAACITFSLI
jgi:hypothetical protein